MKKGRLLVTIIFIALFAMTISSCVDCDRKYLDITEDKCNDPLAVYTFLCYKSDEGTGDVHATCCNNPNCYQTD